MKNISPFFIAVLEGITVNAIWLGIGYFFTIPLEFIVAGIVILVIIITIITAIIINNKSKKSTVPPPEKENNTATYDYEYDSVEYTFQFSSRTKIFYEKKVMIHSLIDNFKKEKGRRFSWSGNKIENACYRVTGEDKKEIKTYSTNSLKFENYKYYDVDFNTSLSKDTSKQYSVTMDLYDENKKMEQVLGHNVAVKLNKLSFKIITLNDVKIKNVKISTFDNMGDVDSISSENLTGDTIGTSTEYKHKVETPGYKYYYEVSWDFD